MLCQAKIEIIYEKQSRGFMSIVVIKVNELSTKTYFSEADQSQDQCQTSFQHTFGSSNLNDFCIEKEKHY